MPSTNNYSSTDQGIFALFKGDSGSGKSCAALSFPNAYVFDHDRKMPNIALKHADILGLDDTHKIDWDVFDDVFQLQDKLDRLWNDCPYETIISDSITHLVINVFNSVGKQRNESPVQFIRNMKPPSARDQDPNKMSIDYYNAETNFIERYWINMLKTWWARPGNPKNVIVTAHVMTVESSPDLKSKEITRTRGIVTAGKKVGAYIPTEFDDIYHFGYSSGMAIGSSNERLVFFDALGEDSAKCSVQLPTNKMNFTNKSFYKEFMRLRKGDICI
jgi:hypothetical protein